MLATAVRPQLASRTACFAQTRQTVRVSRSVVVCAQQQEGQDERSLLQKMALPAAALMGAALMFASTPDAAEAARSGGRVGGSSGFRSAPRAAPRAAPSAASTGGNRVTNNVYVAPPLGGGFGYGMPFFGGGMGFYPMGMGMGFGGFGAIFSIMALLLMVNVVLSVVSGFTNQKEKKKFDDEDW